MDRTSEKKKPRFNAVDFAVIILIAAALALTVTGYLFARSSDSTRNIVFHLKIKNPAPEYSDSIRVGDKVFNHSDGSLIGTVTEISDSLLSGTESDDSVYITVKAQATKADKGFIVNGTNISAGNSLEIRFPHLFCKAKCVGVEDTGR